MDIKFGYDDETKDLSPLVGATITHISGCEAGSEEIILTTDRGALCMRHDSDCCESVEVVDVTGDPADLIGGVVVLAEVRESDPPENADQIRNPEYIESETWTLYEIRTTKGDITIRWLGRSNGYYGETANLYWRA